MSEYSPPVATSGATMTYQRVGRTDLDVSRLGFGAASYWGKAAFSERDAIALVRQALDGGINFFDTGPSYSDGNAEARLGRALRDVARTELVIATKVGTRLGRSGAVTKDFKPSTIRRSVEQSVRSLGVDRLSLLFLHGPTVENLGAETQDCLAGLVEEGLVAYLGLNSFEPTVIEAALGLGVFSCLMVDYSILRIAREPLIDAWAKAGKGVIAAGAMGRAIVGNRLLRLRSPADRWYLARALGTRRDDIRRSLRYRFINRVEGWSPSQVALGFVLANPAVSSALVGTTDGQHLAENLASAGRELSIGLQQRILAAAM